MTPAISHQIQGRVAICTKITVTAGPARGARRTAGWAPQTQSGTVRHPDRARPRDTFLAPELVIPLYTSGWHQSYGDSHNKKKTEPMQTG